MRYFSILMCLGFLDLGCTRPHKPVPAQPTPTPIRVLSQYHPGMPLAELLAEMNLAEATVRYRGGLTENRKSAVYFFEEGDLHVDAVRNEGAWVLSSVPFFELKSEPAAARVKKWDTGAELKIYEEKTGKSMH